MFVGGRHSHGGPHTRSGRHSHDGPHTHSDSDSNGGAHANLSPTALKTGSISVK